LQEELPRAVDGGRNSIIAMREEIDTLTEYKIYQWERFDGGVAAHIRSQVDGASRFIGALEALAERAANAALELETRVRDAAGATPLPPPLVQIKAERSVKVESAFEPRG
jgi:hypothetical protein